MSKGLLSVAVL